MKKRYIVYSRYGERLGDFPYLKFARECSARYPGSRIKKKSISYLTQRGWILTQPLKSSGSPLKIWQL